MKKAREVSIKGRSSMTKAELFKVLRNNRTIATGPWSQPEPYRR